MITQQLIRTRIVSPNKNVMCRLPIILRRLSNLFTILENRKYYVHTKRYTERHVT
jgi:hypothetical protein